MDKICYTPSTKHLMTATPMEASAVNAKLWQPGDTIRIQFLNGSSDQRDMIRTHAEEWLKYANLKFDWVSGGGMIKIEIANSGGSYSYIGRDCLNVSGHTMRFAWLDAKTIKHEFGHSLGLLHSHNSKNFPYTFDEAEVIKDLSGPPNNWSLATIHSNVLDKTTENTTESPWEPNNIMNYFMPKRWIVEGVAIEPGDDIGPNEIKLITQAYPKNGDDSGIDSGIREIRVGENVRGVSPSIFKFKSEGRTYMVRGNAKILVNGRQFRFGYSPAGTYTLNVIAPRSFNFVIKAF